MFPNSDTARGSLFGYTLEPSVYMIYVATAAPSPTPPIVYVALAMLLGVILFSAPAFIVFVEDTEIGAVYVDDDSAGLVPSRV